MRQYVYQAQVLLCLQQGDLTAAFNTVEQAKSRAFLDLLHPFGLQESAASQPLTLEEVQAHLPKGSALVEFFATGISGPSEMMIRHLPAQTHFLRDYLAPAERLFAFVVTRQQLDSNAPQ